LPFFAKDFAKIVYSAFSKPEPLRGGTSSAPTGCQFAGPRHLRAKHYADDKVLRFRFDTKRPSSGIVWACSAQSFRWHCCPALSLPALAKSVTLYVAADGNDAWSGRLPAPAKNGKDGPLATLPRALKSAREARANFKEAPGAVTILIRGGNYGIAEPLEITSADSGQSAEKALIIAAYRNEQPVLSAGRRITGWKRSADNPNMWQAEIPKLREAGKYFHSSL